MGLADIAAQIDADNRAKALAATFGHLAPQQSTVYTGTILFAHSVYGDGSVPIVADFADLEDSPWFYDGMCTFLMDHADELGADAYGRVFRWNGTYELKIWPDVWTDDDSQQIQEAGHEHVFAGAFTEITTG